MIRANLTIALLSPEEALDAEIIACTDDDEERDSGVDDDNDFEEEFVDRLIQKYL